MSLQNILIPRIHTPLSDSDIARLIAEHLGDWKVKCDLPGADMVILSQRAFGKSKDEIFLLGLATKYAGIAGKDVAIASDPTASKQKQEGRRIGLAKEAKAIVALAFRNGPIEELHAEQIGGQPNTRRITGQEMARIMKNAVDHVYRLLWLKAENPERYESEIEFGSGYTTDWEDPTVAGFEA